MDEISGIWPFWIAGCGGLCFLIQIEQPPISSANIAEPQIREMYSGAQDKAKESKMQSCRERCVAKLCFSTGRGSDSNDNAIFLPTGVQLLSFVCSTGGKGSKLRLWNIQNLGALSS